MVLVTKQIVVANMNLANHHLQSRFMNLGLPRSLNYVFDDPQSWLVNGMVRMALYLPHSPSYPILFGTHLLIVTHSSAKPSN